MRKKIILLFWYLVVSLSFSLGQEISYLEGEDATKIIRYGNWIEKSLSSASGEKYLSAHTPYDKLQFKFYGKSISFIFLKSEHGGMVDVLIDGKIFSTFDLYEPDLEKYAKAEKFLPQEFLLSSNLPEKEHNVDIVIKESKNLSSKGTNIYLDLIKFGNFSFSTISANILSSDEKTPVEQARVEVFSPREKNSTAYSTASGNITISSLRAGKYELNITAQGYENKIVPLNLSEGEHLNYQINLLEKPYSKPIGLIKKPLSTQPQIIKRGDVFAVHCAAGKNSKNWKVNLYLGENIYPLKISKKDFDQKKQMWILFCKISKDTPLELYDLEVINNKVKDLRPRAVKIVEKYKNNFYFAHLTDTHIGGPYPFAEETLQKTFEELNITRPEFIIITGDLTDNGKTKEYLKFLEILNNSRVPTYLIPGNHDVEAYKDMEQLLRWKRYIGENYYSLRYGDYNFLLLDNSGNGEGSRDSFATSDFDKEQLQWAENILEENQDSKLQFFLYHIPTREDVSYVHQLADKYKVKLVLYGHGHEDRVDISGTTPTNYVETTSLAMERRYRVVRIENDNVKFNYGDSDRLSMSAGRTKISFDFQNDGTSIENKAVIKNPMRETYQTTIKFIMPKDKNYEVEGSNLYQVIKGQKYNLYYVSTTLEPQSNAQVIIKTKEP